MSRKPYLRFSRTMAVLCALFLVAGILFSPSSCLPEASAAQISTDFINILLIGQDRREDEQFCRADSILLCSFQPESRRIIMTSFLRDLYLPIPGHSDNRLNAAYAHGGMALLRQTLEENFRIPIDGCVEMDFCQFAQVLDALGGVTIELRQDEADAINKSTDGTLTAGSQLLTGAQALAYTRIRSLDEDGDFSRTFRQRKVISSLLSSYQDAGVFTVLSMIPEILPMLSTDMEKKQVVSTVLQLLPMLGKSTFTSQTVPAEGMYTYSTIRGMAVLTGDLEKIRQELSDTLSGKEGSTDS